MHQKAIVMISSADIMNVSKLCCGKVIGFLTCPERRLSYWPQPQGCGGRRILGHRRWDQCFLPQPRLLTQPALPPACTQPPHKTPASRSRLFSLHDVGGQRWQQHHPSGLKASPTTEARHRGTDGCGGANRSHGAFVRPETTNHKPQTRKSEEGTTRCGKVAQPLLFVFSFQV